MKALKVIGNIFLWLFIIFAALMLSLIHICATAALAAIDYLDWNIKFIIKKRHVFSCLFNISKKVN